MGTLKTEIRDLIEAIKLEAIPYHSVEVSDWLNSLVLDGLIDGDVCGLIQRLVFELELGNKGLKQWLVPEAIPELQAKTDAVMKQCIRECGYFVMRTHTQTNLKTLWKVESRRIHTLSSARDWCEFMKSEGNDKHEYFVLRHQPGDAIE